MVFFCCNQCGSSIKKPQVEKHLSQCRTASLSCMDCHKDFRGDEYKTHTKCISEEQKYAADGWKAPASRNKGEKKQMAWVETVQAVVESAGNTLKPAARSLLSALRSHENVPRKKPKFLNFVQNVGKGRFDQGTIDQVWDLLEAQGKKEREREEAEKLKAKEEKEAAVPAVVAKPSANGDVEDGVDGEKVKKDKKKKKKDKDLAAVEDTQAEVPTVVAEEVEGESKSKKKKSKKRKGDEDQSLNETNLEDSLVVEATPSTVENGDGETKSKKKKSKKRKAGDEDLQNSTLDESVISSTVETPTVVESGDGEIGSKKRKSKKQKISDENEQNVSMAEELINGVEASTVQEDNQASKKKKSKKSDQILLENGQNESEMTENGTPEKCKKRKHEEVTENQEDNDLDEETKRMLKKQRKAERKAAKAAQSLSLTETNGNAVESEKDVLQTPEEIKARQKAERKLARKSAKGLSQES